MIYICAPRVSSAFQDYALSPDCTISPFRRLTANVCVYILYIFIHATSHSTEAFRGGNRDCCDAQRKWILGNVLLIIKIHIQLYPSRQKRLKLREREREKEKSREEGKRARIEASERVVEAERDLEPWKAPITPLREFVCLSRRDLYLNCYEPQSGVRIQILNVTNTPKRLSLH